MPIKRTKSIRILNEIIEICTKWLQDISENNEDGKEILKEFEEESVVEVLSDYI